MTAEELTAGPHDEVVLRLRDLRTQAGEPSYAEIARWVAEARSTRGWSAEAARVPRTTVYDAFRLGRRRIDRELVADIEATLLRCVSVDVEAQDVEPITAPPTEPTTAPTTEPTTAPVGAERTLPLRLKLAITVTAVALNLLLTATVLGLHFPLWLDMSGTAIAAIALGPWWGVAVAVGTHGLKALLTPWGHPLFVLVSILGALIWGYGVRKVAVFRRLAGFFLLNLCVAFACSVLAVLITVLAYDWRTGHESENTADVLTNLLHTALGGTFLANLLTSVLDKSVSGFFALGVVDGLRSRWPGISPYAPRARREPTNDATAASE